MEGRLIPLLRTVIALVIAGAVGVAASEAPTIPGIGKWWYAELPNADGLTPERVGLTEQQFKRAKYAVKEISERRRALLKPLSEVQEAYRPFFSYVFRLENFRNSGPPIGTPLQHISDYWGVTLCGADLIAAIARKAEKDNTFAGTMRKIAADRMIRASPYPAVRMGQSTAIEVLLVMGLLVPRDVDELRDVDPERVAEIDCAIKSAPTDRQRLLYGKTWGPVGENAVQNAISDLGKQSINLGEEKLPMMNSSDDKWIICISVLRRARAKEGIPVLLKFMNMRAPEEPSDLPWNDSCLNCYPAVSALMEFSFDVPDEIAHEIESDRPLPYDLTFLTYVLAGILGPKEYLEWLNDLGNKYTKVENEKLRLDSLAQIAELKDVLYKTKYVPEFLEPRPFFGPVNLSTTLQPRQGPERNRGEIGR